MLLIIWQQYGNRKVEIMIKHIVMWKLKDFAAGSNKNENAVKIKTELEMLKSKIPEIKKLEVGININESETAYDIVLYSEFETKKGFGNIPNASRAFKSI